MACQGFAFIRIGQSHSACVLDRQQRLGTFDHAEFFHFIHLFRMAGVRVWSVAEGELTGQEIAASFRSLAGSHSEREEQFNKAGNVARGMLNNARKGRYKGGTVPTGYDRLCVSPDGVARFRLIDEDREPNPGYVRGSREPGERRWRHECTVIYPNGHTERLRQPPGKSKDDRYEYTSSLRTERIVAVREVYHLYDEGLSQHEIARAMNRTNAERGQSIVWSSHLVRRILMNPIYGGVMEWKKTTQAKYVS